MSDPYADTPRRPGESVAEHRLCANCGEMPARSRNEPRCGRCYSYWRRHGLREERPLLNAWGGKWGYNPANWGASDDSRYAVWVAMRQRCLNPADLNYSRYGAVGISICDQWREDFWKFASDVGERPSLAHTLDRYPNYNGNYEPDNVRWATATEQANNTRRTTLVTIGDRTQSICDWCRELGIKRTTLLRRINRGWPVECLFIAPDSRQRVRGRKRKSGWQKQKEAGGRLS